MNTFLKQIMVIQLIVLLTSVSHAQFGRKKIDLDCKHIDPIENSYLSRHITYSKKNKNLERKTVDQFIKKLDPTKIYLLQSDTVQLKNSMKGIFSNEREKKCQKIRAAHALYKKRVSERVAFVKSYLGKKYKLDEKAEFVFDPDERGYAKTKDQGNAFHKKYLHFQVANYVSTDIKLNKAKKNVIKNYDRLVKRVEDFDDQDLWSLYLDAFAHSLDPHSSYLSSDQLEDFEISMRLSLEGIGATLSSKDGFTVIEQLIPGGAAERSGKLKPKDKIISVAQGEKDPFQNVIDMDLRDVVRLIRGKKGSKVRLQIHREKGDSKRFIVTLVRDKIKLEDEAAMVKYFDRKIGNETVKLGLLNLPSFYADNRRRGRSATKDVAKLLEEAKKKNVKGMVLDLSTNGGGSLDDAVKIAGLFFKTGNVVKQSSRDSTQGEIELADQDPTVQWPGPLVVLISRISASASEIVAGTLQAYDRAVVVGGDHTFGKGSVQSVEPLPPGLGALKTTVGMFFIPSGHSTQHRGVDSDIIMPSAYSNDEIGEKTLDYSLPPKKLKQFVSKNAFVTTGFQAWKPVKKNDILKLRKNSEQRVKSNEEFKKLKEDIAKAKEKGRVIKVAEVLGKDQESKKDKKEEEEDEDRILTKEEKLKKYLERADIQESINILADLVALENKVPLTIGKKAEKEIESKN